MTEETKGKFLSGCVVDGVVLHSRHVPTKEELYVLADKLARKHGFKSLPHAVMYAAKAKEAENG